jgi:hypothetical protein
MLTPNGRFDIEKKICLTISGYHPDQWSAMWNIQKILGAFLSVMTSDLDHGISHIKKSKEERQELAARSLKYNIENYPAILKGFSRFVIYDEPSKNYTIKTNDQVRAEMPKKKVKTSGEDTPFDINQIKLTNE